MSTYSNDITTTRSDDPEVIRRDIESTRADLSRNVDALTEKVSPSRVVWRKVDRAKDAVGSMKDKVMGSDDNPYDHGSMGGAADKASSVASSVGDTVTSAPTTARQKTRGNPLAAGMIAFGVGWLASSLLPATEKEQEAATAVKDKASEHSDTLTAPIKEAAGNAKENLRGPAQDAVQSVKGTATEATATVKDEASSAKDDITGNGSARS
jgi:uncharacterized protein YjbJ (UPF0337 family)